MKSFKQFISEYTTKTEAFEPKERFVPEDGKDCRVPTHVVGQTVSGKILRQGRTKGQWQVKTKDGEIGSYKEDELFDPSLGCEQYAKYKWSK